ncbi:MAG: Hpt domain-containing protein [Paracoccaceae bacterium]|nr:Hpt domain-containing protein [Paracoccaceae bacterium]
MIDWVRVADLRSEIGDDGFGEVIDLFLEETDEVIARLTDQPVSSDIARELHFLKGSALSLGFDDLANLCQEGERRANLGDHALIDVAQVITVYHASKAEFATGLVQILAA